MKRMTILSYLLPLVSALFFSSASLANDPFVIVLKSNKNAEFYVDGETVGMGRIVHATINSSDPHMVLVKPDGYLAKEEYLEPPYYPNTSFDFYFMIGDKEG